MQKTVTLFRFWHRCCGRTL